MARFVTRVELSLCLEILSVRLCDTRAHLFFTVTVTGLTNARVEYSYEYASASANVAMARMESFFLSKENDLGHESTITKKTRLET